MQQVELKHLIQRQFVMDFKNSEFIKQPIEFLLTFLLIDIS